MVYCGHALGYFWHENISRKDYCDRPYKQADGIEPDVVAMNEDLILKWNNVVKPTDTIIHVGDVALGKREQLKPIIQRLNGYKILIRGNHDRSKSCMLDAGFNEVHKNLLLDTEHGRIFLSHVPMLNVKDRPEADWYVNGHVHLEWRRINNFINVGVDVWNFTPITIKQAING